MNDPDRLYKIIRFRRDGPNQVLERGLTLDEAQAHCEREDTHGEGWFDGYEYDVLTDEDRAEREQDEMRWRDAIRKLGALGI